MIEVEVPVGQARNLLELSAAQGTTRPSLIASAKIVGVRDPAGVLTYVVKPVAFSPPDENGQMWAQGTVDDFNVAGCIDFFTGMFQHQLDMPLVGFSLVLALSFDRRKR